VWRVGEGGRVSERTEEIEDNITILWPARPWREEEEFFINK